MNLTEARCDIACVLMLARRSIAACRRATRMILTGMTIPQRLAPNVSDEPPRRFDARFGELFRIYLRGMGVETELLDIVDTGIQPPGVQRNCRHPNGTGCASHASPR